MGTPPNKGLDNSPPNKGLDNENSCFFASVDSISPDSPNHINVSNHIKISLEGCFVSRLENIYLLFLSI